MSRSLTTISVVLLLLWAASGLAWAGTLQAAASFVIIADFVKEVGGERVEVVSLVPAAADPHSWEPTAKEARFLAGADVLYINGEGYEEWLADLTASAAGPNLEIVNLSEGLAAIPGPSHSVHHDHGDPHFWLSVPNAVHYVERIYQSLAELDPDGAGYYRERAERYIAKLWELDGWLQEQLAAIPEQNRILVTYHNAFAYFAERYGFSAVEFLVSNPEREPSAQEMAALIRVLAQMGTPVIFSEPQFSIGTRYVNSVAAEIGAEVRTLYSATFTDAIPAYIDLMRYNGQVLLEALR